MDCFDGSRNIRAISLKLLLFCCFDFDPKIYAKCIYLVYHLFILVFCCKKKKEVGSLELFFERCFIPFYFLTVLDKQTTSRWQAVNFGLVENVPVLIVKDKSAIQKSRNLFLTCFNPPITK